MGGSHGYQWKRKERIKGWNQNRRSKFHGAKQVNGESNVKK